MSNVNINVNIKKSNQKYTDIDVPGYPRIKIKNTTDYVVYGEVDYLSFLCSDDNWAAVGQGHWLGPERGLCLLTKITGYVSVGGNIIRAEPYTSSGTAVYSEFKLIQTGTKPLSFKICHDC